jgi:broad specificity phosphatase PhoE
LAQLAWLGVVRHGESVGNVAANTAEAAGHEVIDIAERDADVPLSSTGRAQAAALGGWLADLPAPARPQVVICSPYLRAVQTARIALDSAGLDVPMPMDERLRDRELGILDLLTTTGVARRLPGEAARQRRLGRFYYRPPGGESWTDVALRLRSLLSSLVDDRPGERVLLVAHDAVVVLLRYLIEGLTEAQVIDLARGSVPNSSLTAWEPHAGTMRPTHVYEVGHLDRYGVPRTRQEHVGTDAH